MINEYQRKTKVKTMISMAGMERHIFKNYYLLIRASISNQNSHGNNAMNT